MILRNFLLKNPKKYLIFDFDETIAKMDIDWFVWNERVANVIKHYDPSFVYLRGIRLNMKVNSFVRKYGEEFRKKVVELTKDYETEYCKGFIPNIELINFIRSNNSYSFYLISNNTEKTIRKALKQFKIEDKFQEIISREKVIYTKPETEGLEKIVDDNDKRQYLFIGDSLSDREAAKRIKMDFFQVDYFRKK